MVVVVTGTVEVAAVVVVVVFVVVVVVAVTTWPVVHGFAPTLSHARGKGAIPASKTGLLKFGEPEPDENTSFEPEKFGARKTGLGKIKKKK